MIVRKTRPGFALVEVVVVALLLGGAFIVFIEALNHTKIMQVKSEVKTIQTVLLNSKINQIRNTPFIAIYPVNNLRTWICILQPGATKFWGFFDNFWKF